MNETIYNENIYIQVFSLNAYSMLSYVWICSMIKIYVLAESVKSGLNQLTALSVSFNLAYMIIALVFQSNSKN